MDMFTGTQTLKALDVATTNLFNCGEPKCPSPPASNNVSKAIVEELRMVKAVSCVIEGLVVNVRNGVAYLTKQEQYHQ